MVFILFAWPFPDIPEADQFGYSDKIAHMILFGVVTFLLYGSIKSKGVGQKAAGIIGLLGGAGYAGVGEIMQIFIPGRDCSLYDFYAGVIGPLLVLTGIYLLKIIKKNR